MGILAFPPRKKRSNSFSPQHQLGTRNIVSCTVQAYRARTAGPCSPKLGRLSTGLRYSIETLHLMIRSRIHAGSVQAEGRRRSVLTDALTTSTSDSLTSSPRREAIGWISLEFKNLSIGSSVVKIELRLSSDIAFKSVQRRLRDTRWTNDKGILYMCLRTPIQI
ncbi:hypothetical protein EVAR_56245_1 [Eumeta japonica]|uniref:Uncharacterized protein n=1 Tax=Eumeta variegata TaxID=151549 RepID=A0A4C1XKD2_EUMVA|nr:hypothetical protein EVAR_56245_1 [Eumeta japonica]